VAKSIARIHHDNLVNFGIVPLVFNNPTDYERIDTGNKLLIGDLRYSVTAGKEIITIRNMDKGEEYPVKLSLSERQRKILAAGGMLNWMKKQQSL